MEAQLRKRDLGRLDVRPEFELVAHDTIIGSARWTGAEGRPRERFQVMTLRDGKIADIQGCRTRREAERFARRRQSTGG